MKLLTLGCSFTKGSELSDPTKSCWPAVLSRRLGWDLENLSEYGGSNDMMFRKAMETEEPKGLIIVAWSESHRMEVWLNEKLISQRRQYSKGPFSVNYKSAAQNLEWVKPFFANHYDEQYFLRKWLCQAVALQDHFKLKNQKYLFVSAFGNEEPLKKYHGSLKSKIDERYWIGWPYESMMTWTSGQPYGAHGHFLEQGHLIVANRIYEHIRHLGWIS